MLQMLMITQKYVIFIRLYFIASLKRIFLDKNEVLWKNRKFVYYIQHQLIHFLHANQNKIFNWIKVDY